VTDRRPGARIVRAPGVAAAVIAWAIDAVYLAAIAQQGTSSEHAVVPFVGSLIAVLGVCSATSEAVEGIRLKTALAGVGSGGLIALGIFGIFSIGLLLLAAALFASVSTVRAVRAGGPASIAIACTLAGVVIAAAGLVIVYRV